MIKDKLKIICLYQVVMHYRVPFYERLSADDSFSFKLFYGQGEKGPKLTNAPFDKQEINVEELRDFHVGQSFAPSIFFTHNFYDFFGEKLRLPCE